MQMDDLARLAALHGVATAFQPAADVTVPVPEATVKAVLGLLGVITDDAESVRAQAADAVREAAGRLLPRTVVLWQGNPCRPSRPDCRRAPGCGSPRRRRARNSRGVPHCPSGSTGSPPRPPTGGPGGPP
ncbi:hypothetical protein GCM10020254_54850 [Streptomyces goshikiensis]